MNIPYVFKRCTKCGEYKVANTEYFHKQSTGRYGLMADCKECKKKYRQSDKGKKVRKKYKQSEKGKETERKYRQSDKYKEYLQLDKRKEYLKEYYESDKYKEYLKEYNRSEQGKASRKRYRQSDKGQIALFNGALRRRSKEQNQGSGITKEQWRECMEYFDWKCAYSGKPLKEGNRSLDHITPLNLGGENEIWNLVPMYINYNSSKKDKEMIEWYKEQPFYSEDRLKKIYEWQEYAYNKYYKEVAYCTI